MSNSLNILIHILQCKYIVWEETEQSPHHSLLSWILPSCGITSEQQINLSPVLTSVSPVAFGELLYTQHVQVALYIHTYISVYIHTAEIVFIQPPTMFKKATNYAKAFESEELYQRQRSGASRERAAISHRPTELWREQPFSAFENQDPFKRA